MVGACFADGFDQVDELPGRAGGNVGAQLDGQHGPHLVRGFAHTWTSAAVSVHSLEGICAVNRTTRTPLTCSLRVQRARGVCRVVCRPVGAVHGQTPESWHLD